VSPAAARQVHVEAGRRRGGGGAREGAGAGCSAWPVEETAAGCMSRAAQTKRVAAGMHLFATAGAGTMGGGGGGGDSMSLSSASPPACDDAGDTASGAAVAHSMARKRPAPSPGRVFASLGG
jgi:hypothetical protein